MAAQPDVATAPMMGEAELRRGMELLYFGHAHLTRSIDRDLAKSGLGRAHHRALYFIARQPDMTVTDLLSLLAITKQSLGRVLNELTQRKLVDSRPGDRDRRQRLLRLSDAGVKMESELFEELRRRITAAYRYAGEEAIAGYWAVLEGMIPPRERDRVARLSE